MLRQIRHMDKESSDAFHLSDFFLDNTESRFIADDETQPNRAWNINDNLGRLIRLVTHRRIERPTIDETAMFAAWGAGMRSSCLSRQVGAAILNARGNVIATGTNEVPKAGGGVYGTEFGAEVQDDRCFVRKGYCSNTIEQSTIATAILDDIRHLLQSNVDENAICIATQVRPRRRVVGIQPRSACRNGCTSRRRSKRRKYNRGTTVRNDISVPLLRKAYSVRWN